MDDRPASAVPRFSLRLVFGEAAMLGPGKVDLLEHIRQTGSISAAGRQMKMSYKRAWTLVEAMNTTFHQPLVESARGGAGGGGARLTPAGEVVLTCYRALEATVAEAGAAQIATLQALACDIPHRK